LGGYANQRLAATTGQTVAMGNLIHTNLRQHTQCVFRLTRSHTNVADTVRRLSLPATKNTTYIPMAMQMAISPTPAKEQDKG